MYFNNSSLINDEFISGPVDGYKLQSLWYVPLGRGSILFVVTRRFLITFYSKKVLVILFT